MKKIAFKNGEFYGAMEDTEIGNVSGSTSVVLQPLDADEVLFVSDEIFEQATEHPEKVKLSKDKKSVDVIK